MSQHDEERAMERLDARSAALVRGWHDRRTETWASKDIEAVAALLDDARLRQALGYLEDCAADEIWAPLKGWIEDRDHLLSKLGGGR